MRYVVSEKGVPKDNIHLVGLSLGAHLAGYVGKEVPGIGRITGKVFGGVLLRAFGVGGGTTRLHCDTSEIAVSACLCVCLFLFFLVCFNSKIDANREIRRVSHNYACIHYCM